MHRKDIINLFLGVCIGQWEQTSRLNTLSQPLVFQTLGLAMQCLRTSENGYLISCGAGSLLREKRNPTRCLLIRQSPPHYFTLQNAPPEFTMLKPLKSCAETIERTFQRNRHGLAGQKNCSSRSSIQIQGHGSQQERITAAFKSLYKVFYNVRKY